MTHAAFENAITVVMALGGSTNAVLHLIAIAASVGVKLGLDDFQRISDRTPYLADLKPSGRWLMEDLSRVGGVPAVLRLLLAGGYLHGDCLTVTGRTLAENLAEARTWPPARRLSVRWSIRSRSMATSRSSTATWPRMGRWPSSPVRRATVSRGRPRCSTPKRRRSGPWSRGGWRAGW